MLYWFRQRALNPPLLPLTQEKGSDLIQILNSSFLVFRYSVGTGSSPPSLQGLQRMMRQTVSGTPWIRPNFEIA